MNSLYIALNVVFLTIVLFWAFYQAHIADTNLNRWTFLLICLATTIVIITRVVPNDSVLHYAVSWQGSLFNFSLAVKCCANFYSEYGTAKWREAFTNSKAKFIHFTK